MIGLSLLQHTGCPMKGCANAGPRPVAPRQGAAQLPNNPYNGHTLRDVLRTETLTGCSIERAYVDKG